MKKVSKIRTKKPQTVKQKTTSIFKSEDYIKIRPIQGGLTYQPKILIDNVDILPTYMDEDHQTEKDLGCRISYNFKDGTSIMDKQFFKNEDEAAKVVEPIILSLPKPTLPQVTPNITYSNEELEPVGKQQVGFIGNEIGDCNEE